MLIVSDNEIKARLEFDNPWWVKGEGIDKILSNYPRRSYFSQFEKLVFDKSVNRAVILMGPRRVGKTVMIQHTIQGLLDKGIDSKSILYLSIETPIYTGLSLEKLVILFQELHKHTRKDALYIFFDEIQYLKNWEVHLKSLVDSFSAYKFIGTGSAAAALKLKSQESGAGRFTDFLLPPLTFAEYLRFKKIERQLIKAVSNDEGIFEATNIEALNNEFIEYLNYGGYPEAVFSQLIQGESSRYIKSDIIDKVLLRDLPSLYGISDIQELNTLFTTIAYNSGNEISLESLSNNSGVAKNTLKKYLEYLEAAFLIRIVKRVDENAKQFKRANFFKVYLTNPSMRAALFGFINADSDSMGSMTETAIYSQWLHSDDIEKLRYARWRSGEVDIVYLSHDKQKPNWVVEIKWSNRFFENPGELKSLLTFVKKNQLKEIWVTTKTKRGIKEIYGIPIRFIPSSELTFMIGNNILKRKGSQLTGSKE